MTSSGRLMFMALGEPDWAKGTQPASKKTSIQLYHQLLKDRKNIEDQHQKMQNRIHLVDKVQQKIQRQTMIDGKRQEYKAKYRSLYNRSVTQNRMSASIYRKPQPVRRNAGEDENKITIQQVRKASQFYKGMIQKNKNIQKQRKLLLVTKVRQQKKQVKRTLEDLKSHKAFQVQQQILGKIKAQKKSYVDVSRSLQKLTALGKQKQTIWNQSSSSCNSTSHLFKRIV